MKKYITLVVAILILLTSSCWAQTRPSWLQLGDTPLIDIRTKGAKADGITDNRAAIQAAIDEGSIFIPAVGTFLVNPLAYAGITIPSNRTIVFEEGAVVKCGATSETEVNFFLVADADNVTFVNLTLDGNKSNYTGPIDDSAYTIGLSIRGDSSNIKVLGGHIYDFVFDGVYVRDTAAGAHVVLRDLRVSGAMRNAISLITVNGITLENLELTDTGGQAAGPGAGVDFEPSDPANEQLTDIVMNNIRISSATLGLSFVPYSSDIDVVGTGITINDISSIAINHNGYLTLDAPDEIARVVLNDVSVASVSYNAVAVRLNNANYSTLEINNIKVSDINTKETTGAYGAVFAVFRTAAQSGIASYAFPIGGLHISCADVDAPLAASDMVLVGQAEGVKHIGFIDPTNMEIGAGSDALISYAVRQGFGSDIFVRDVNKKLSRPSSISSLYLADTGGEAGNDRMVNILTYLDRHRKNLGYAGQSLALSFKAGSLTSQVRLTGVDLSWVSLSSDGPIVALRSAMTGEVSGAGTPVIGGTFSTMPSLSSFTLSLDTSSADTTAHHIIGLNNSSMYMGVASLTSNDGAGVFATRGSKLVIGDSIFSGTSAQDVILEGGTLGSVFSVSSFTVNVTANTPAVEGLLFR